MLSLHGRDFVGRLGTSNAYAITLRAHLLAADLMTSSRQRPLQIFRLPDPGVCDPIGEIAAPRRSRAVEREKASMEGGIEARKCWPASECTPDFQPTT